MDGEGICFEENEPIGKVSVIKKGKPLASLLLFLYREN